MLPFHHIMATVKESCLDYEAASSLSLAWLYIYGMPEEAKQDHIIKPVSEAIGKLMVIDEGWFPGWVQCAFRSYARILLGSTDTCFHGSSLSRWGGRLCLSWTQRAR